MKTKYFLFSIISLCMAQALYGQAGAMYTNFVRQVQFLELPSNDRITRDVSVAPLGESLSPLIVNSRGATFELWTVKSDPLTVYLLDRKFVSTYVPTAAINIITEDPNTYNAVPRTRADRPFYVDVTISGLRSETDAPLASRSVKLLRHVQSYGINGNETNINRLQASLIHQVSLTSNATHRLSYAITSVPGNDRSKVRGEERFSVFSIQDYQSPEAQLASMYVQIWPVSSGAITGISHNQTIRYKLPQITLTMNDLYPDSNTYAQVYKGPVRNGVEGTAVPGGAWPIFQSYPDNKTLVVDNWDATITEDGQWTLELLTASPFDIVRLAHVTFTVDRTMDVNGGFTTLD